MAKSEPDKKSCLYFDMTQQERDSAIRYLLGAIIKTRSDSSFPSNYYTFDEDVNVYLAHLMFAMSLPEYHEMAEPYLSLETSDVLKWVRATEDRTIRYFIFKANADHILIHSAIFEDLGQRPHQKFFRRSPKHFRELAKLYYEQAAAYHKRIYRKTTGVGEVLEKMAHYFEAYQELLKLVRREYFHFVNNFRDQAFNHFLNQLIIYESYFLTKDKMCRFLELYARWLETKNPGLENDILQVVTELKRLDPGFRFDAENEFRGRKGGWEDERKCA